jgi:hypothetical protein
MTEGDFTEENLAHLEILLEAAEIFKERDEQYRGLWRRFGWLDSLFHIRHKAFRLFRKVEEGDTGWSPKDTDNALDLINYAVFAIRNGRDGNRD